MARNLAQRLDRLERLAAEYGIDPGRVVTIKRVFIDPPDMPAEELPEITEPSPAIERPSLPSFKRPLPTPTLGIV